MNNSSQHTFPIFISSTDYNLRDLRADLAGYLTELGYKPILSSSMGFPANSPKLELWESCLEVLEHSFVVVLIIDGKYGKKLNWPNYNNIFNGNKYSPTHGEYKYAHSIKKRMMVFIRKEIIPYYSLYREAKRKHSDPKEIESSIKLLLPDYIDFDVFEFINQVKTTSPIPWIREFEDSTLIKQEVQLKMVNEFAELFMIQNKRLETIVDAFDKAMDSIDPEKRDNILNELNSTKELLKGKKELIRKKEELEKAKNEIKDTRSEQKTNNMENENKIAILNKKIRQMEDQIKDYVNKHNSFKYEDGKIQFLEPPLPDFSYKVQIPITASFHVTESVTYSTDVSCNKCGKKQIVSSIPSSTSNTFYSCGSCRKIYCEKCWPNDTTYCPDCPLI